MAIRDDAYYENIINELLEDESMELGPIELPLPGYEMKKLVNLMKLLDLNSKGGEDVEALDLEDEVNRSLDEPGDDGGEGIDSVGDNEDESEDKERPSPLEVSDEKKKDKKAKNEEGCTVSDRRAKRPKREAPSEEELTQRTVASVLGDLRF